MQAFRHRAGLWLARCVDPLRDLVLPPQCQVCNRVLPSGARLQICGSCRRHLAPPGRRCTQCGVPLVGPAPAADSRCGACRDLALPFAGVVCLGAYRGPLRELVLSMKRPGGEALALQIGRWLGGQVRGTAWWQRVEQVTSVPSHWSRRMLRGGHAADLLAEAVSCRLSRKLTREAVRCVRRTAKQGRLTTPQRFDNVRGVFAAHRRQAARGKRLLIVDDVMTSGATAREVARAARRGGSVELYLALVARGTRHRQ